MSHFVGIDVGGTKSAAVLVDTTGRDVARHWYRHEGTAVTPLPEIVLTSVERVLAESGLARETVAGYGVSVAGLISSDQSTVVHAAKLQVVHLDLGTWLVGRLGRPVLVENDAAATLFGHSYHAGTNSSNGSTDVALLLTIGTGLGGSIMVGGRPVTGAHGFAAELGHVTVDFDDDRRCLCGSPGCVENYCSGRGVVALAGRTPPPPGSRALLGLTADAEVTSPMIVELAGRGDPWAETLLAHSGDMLGRALAILCTALDPSSVVIGGSFGHAARRWLIPAAEAEMRRHWPFAGERPLPEIAVDRIGPYAAATGAALLALTTHRRADRD